MAAYLPEAADQVLRRARALEDQLSTDPIGYAIRASRRVGVGLLVAGFGLGAASWYLQAASTTAANNELNVMSNIRTIFGNIKGPTFTPAATGTAPVLGPNPLQDVQNFFSDSWQDIQAIGGDMAQVGGVLGTLGEDVAMGIVDLAKAFIAFVLHFPDILWNGMVWGVGGAAASVMAWLFPYLIVFGGLLIILSIILEVCRWTWGVTFGPGLRMARARIEERAEAAWGRLLRIPLERAVEAVIPAAPAAPGPPALSETSIEAPSRPPEPQTAPMPVPAPESGPEGPGLSLPPEEPPTEPAPGAPEGAGGESLPSEGEGAPAPPPEPTEPTVLTVPTEPETNGTTEATEEILGNVPPSGWTQDQFNAYLNAAPPPPPPPRGREIADVAAAMLEEPADA